MTKKPVITMLALAIFSAIASVHAGVITATNSTYGVFNGSAGTRTLYFASGGSILDLDIAIDFAKCRAGAIPPGGTSCAATGFAFAREVVFRLTSPGATEVNLVNFATYYPGQSGPSPGARITVDFDDEALAAVGGNNFVSGSFRPVGTLSSFDGQNIAGNWTLFIRDTAPGDPLSFFIATISATIADQTVPEPGTLALLGLGLAGLAGTRWRRQ